MDGIVDAMDMSLSKLRDIVKDREAMGLQRIRHDLVTEQQQRIYSWEFSFLFFCREMSFLFLFF